MTKTFDELETKVDRLAAAPVSAGVRVPEEGDYDRSIHSNPDAMAWAKFFCKTIASQPEGTVLDEGYMVSWFANAMMAMHDHVKRERPACPDAEKLARALYDEGAHGWESREPLVNVVRRALERCR